MLSMCQGNSLQTTGRVQSLVVLTADESAEEKYLVPVKCNDLVGKAAHDSHI